MPTISLFGLFGNFITITILKKKGVKLKLDFVRILCSLATYDNLLLVCAFFLFSLPTLSETYQKRIFPLTVPFLYPVTNTFMTCSVYMTVSVAVNRYLDLHITSSSSKSIYNGYIQAGIVFIFSTIMNIPRWFEFRYGRSYDLVNSSFVVTSLLKNGSSVSQVVYSTRNLSVLILEATELRKDNSYIRDYTLIANSFLVVAVPTCIMLLSSVLIYRQMLGTTNASYRFSNERERIRRKRNRNITLMLIGIIFLFLICHIGEIAISVYELVDLLDGERSDFPPWAKNTVICNHLLVVINSSLNFVIYCKDVIFRESAVSIYKQIKGAPRTSNPISLNQFMPTGFRSRLQKSDYSRDAQLELNRINRDLGISLSGDPNAEVVLKELDPQSRILCGIP
nr:G-protein coupled receptor daf-37-like [Lepeophtheirus salmonis]